MSKISTSEWRNPTASSHLLRELELPWTTVGLGRSMQAPVSLTTPLWLMDGIQLKDLAVYRQSSSKCLTHSDFCEKFCFECCWSWAFLILEATLKVENMFWGTYVAEWIRAEQQEKISPQMGSPNLEKWCWTMQVTQFFISSHSVGKKDPDPGSCKIQDSCDPETPPMGYQSSWVGQEMSSHTTHQ